MYRIACIALLLTNTVWAAEPIDYANFTRAESDTMFMGTLRMTGEVGNLAHLRAP